MSELQTSLKFLRAMASKEIYADPKTTKVAICTSGGIVPGMNVVIRSIVKCLEQEYGVQHILGARFGFYGLESSQDSDWITLTAESLGGVQDQGGSILGGGKYRPDFGKIVENLQARGITQLYFIGGYGTMKGMTKLKSELRSRGLNI